MGDAQRRSLLETARLDDHSRGIVQNLPDEAVDQLATAWQAAVQRQDDEVDAAIEGSLSLLPRLVRRRVVKILTRRRT